MSTAGKTWALVLAGGEGRRSSNSTMTPGMDCVPTQFCSLVGGPSLFSDALRRARAIAANDNVCAVVAAQQRQWWAATPGLMPEGNIIVQPENRGTANGILLALLHILERDPHARIVLLPSDHYVQVESLFNRSLCQAIAKIESGANELLLLGAEPDAPDTDLDYILPGIDAGHRTYQVSRFIQKPNLALERTLIDHGALWSTSIFAVSGRALLKSFEWNHQEIVEVMRGAVQSDRRAAANGIVTLRVFEDLPALDFSRDIIEGQAANLQVVSMLPCGWSDLGAHRRLIETLHRFEFAAADSTGAQKLAMHHNLAAQYAGKAVQFDLLPDEHWRRTFELGARQD